MMKKLGIVVMTAFFSVSVAGLSFADEKKPMAPAAPAAEKAAPTKPTDVKEVQEAPKRVKPKMRMRKATGTAIEAPVAPPAPTHTPERK